MFQLDQIAQKTAKNLIASVCSQPFTPECNVYKVMNKIYLMSFELNGTPVLNLKVEPTHGEMLRDIYPFIGTGYHMNKQHWISIYQDHAIDAELVEDLIVNSYVLVISKLKKVERLALEMLKKNE